MINKYENFIKKKIKTIVVFYHRLQNILKSSSYPRILSQVNSIKKKQWVNPTLENECELKRFKACAVYPRVGPFWIYTTVSFFKKPSPLSSCVCVLKIFSILKRKNSGLIPHQKMSMSKRGIAVVTAYKANFEKSYLTNLIHRFKIV